MLRITGNLRRTRERKARGQGWDFDDVAAMSFAGFSRHSFCIKARSLDSHNADSQAPLYEIA